MTQNTAEGSSESRARMTARDFFHSVFKRLHLFIGVPLVIIVLIAVGSMLIQPVYEASTELKIDYTNYDNIGLTDARMRSEDNIIQRKEQQINSEIKVARSRDVIAGVVEDLELWKRWTPASQSLSERKAAAVAELSDGLTVEPSRDSWVIVITFRHTDAEVVADVANAVARHYISTNVEINKLPEASEFYRERMEAEQAELQKLQTAFRQLKNDENVVAYEAQIEQKVVNLTEWESRLTEVEKEILSRRAKIDKINEFLEDNPSIIVPIPEIARIRIIEDLNYRLVTYRLRLSALREKYTERHQEVVNLEQEIAETEVALRTEVQKIIRQEETELRKLEAEREALTDSITGIKDEMMDLQNVEAPYKNYEQQIENKLTLIRDLDRKYKDSLYAGQTDIRLGRVKQISMASKSTTPVFPDLRLNLIVGIPIAILFGLALVIFLDAIDRTFPNPERVERVLGLPVLASINQVDPRKKLFK